MLVHNNMFCSPQTSTGFSDLHCNDLCVRPHKTLIKTVDPTTDKTKTCLTAVCFVAPVVAVVVAVTHQFLGDANPRRAQEVVVHAAQSCRSIREREEQ